MISTRSPTAASAVPRLIAVVVLPTPPFWLARARTRMRRGPNAVHGALAPSPRRRSAVTSTIWESGEVRLRVQAAGEVEARPRFCHLGIRLAPLQEQPPGLWPEERACELEETRQRRKRPRAHHVGPEGSERFRRALQCAWRECPQAPWSRARPRRGRRISCGCFRPDACGNPASRLEGWRRRARESLPLSRDPARVAPLAQGRATAPNRQNAGTRGAAGSKARPDSLDFCHNARRSA